MPGIGLPMCLISAELVLKRIRGDRRGGALPEPFAHCPDERPEERPEERAGDVTAVVG